MVAYTLTAVSCLLVLLSHLLGHVTGLCYIRQAVNQSGPGTIDIEQATGTLREPVHMHALNTVMQSVRCCEEIHMLIQ